MRIIGSLKVTLLLVVMALTGCANTQHYNKAFDSQHSLTNNQCSFTQPSDIVFKVSKQVFVQRGFTIENADAKTGIIKAVRNMQDKEDEEISYNIHASADISEMPGDVTTVSLAASQQTILHRSSTTWWKLLWLIPIIPTGTEYQTIVIKEGNITEPAMYADFCNALKVEATRQNLAAKEAAAKAADRASGKTSSELEQAQSEAKAAVEKAEADRKVNEEKIAAEKAAISKDAARAKEQLNQGEK